MDDYGYSSTIAEAFGVSYKGVKLYDPVYDYDLGTDLFGCVSKNLHVAWITSQQ